MQEDKAGGHGSEALLASIVASLENMKGEEISVMDLSGKSALADYMVVVSGGSQRHVAAIAEKLLEEMKSRIHGGVRVEGMTHCDWVLVDCGDVMVHIFRPEVRAFYNIEKLWAPHIPQE